MRKSRTFLIGLSLAWIISLAGCVVGQNTYQVSVEIVGQGTVNLEENANYGVNTLLAVEASPAAGWVFARWIGDVETPYAPNSTVLVDQSKTIGAVFVQPLESLRQTTGGLITTRTDGSRVEERPAGKEDIRYIMLHAISDAMVNPDAPYQIERIRSIFDRYSVESHYAIDREGNIYRFVPDDQIAAHGGSGAWENNPLLKNNINQYAIGIELLGIGTSAEMLGVVGPVINDLINEQDRGYTEAQYHSLNLLLRHLTLSYEIPRENIISHQAYAPGRKWDPGELFDWGKIDLTGETRGLP